MNPSINPVTISEVCPIDGQPHNLLPVPNKEGYVYCMKCATTFSLEFDTSEPPVEPPIEPPIEPPPSDAIVITPSGGDDTGLVQGKLNELPAGKALMLSGMFSIGNTIWFDGNDKMLTGDPAKQSGMRCRAQGMSGAYGSMLCTTPNTTRCRIVSLELDAANKQVETVFFDGGRDNSIEQCFIHDIAFNPAGAPFGAIHSQNVVNLRVLYNRIERTTGVEGGEGVRGIYVPGVSCWIEGNIVRDVGHTGIAAEGSSVKVFKNTVERAVIQGTGYKLVYRGGGTPGQPALHFHDNTVRSTHGGGLMLQDCGDATVLIENNHFIDCGKQGSTFGAFYSSNQANNVTIRNNRVENCRSVGGLRNARNWTFTDTIIVSGSDILWLEDQCHSITLTRSGKANVGSNCSNITVDGQPVAAKAT